MANLLCVVELVDRRPLPVALEVLGQARRIASQLGATLYAAVPLGAPLRAGEDAIISTLGRHGADKVLLLTEPAADPSTPSPEEPRAGEPLRWGVHGPGLQAVIEALPPSLLLFGDTPGARDVAPRLAARLGAAYLVEGWLDLDGEQLRLGEGAGASARVLPLPEGLEFPVVATVARGRYALASGDEDVEAEVVQAARTGDFVEVSREPDPRARPVVVGEPADAAMQLAEAIGGAVARPGGPLRAPRLALALGEAPFPAAEVRVAVGPARAEAHYVLAGDPARAAEELAHAVEALHTAAAAGAPPADNSSSLGGDR